MRYTNRPACRKRAVAMEAREKRVVRARRPHFAVAARVVVVRPPAPTEVPPPERALEADMSVLVVRRASKRADCNPIAALTKLRTGG